jgi:16S rRNA (uracil1498-N3)-methyltransferase
MAASGRQASFARAGACVTSLDVARTDFSTPRLRLDDELRSGAAIALTPDAANYLVNVLRLKAGARVLVFNGRDGEFAARLDRIEKKRASLILAEKLREQETAPPIDYLFAPLKHARLDYMAQKAVEMGARSLRPVITRRTQATRVNLDRLEANAREATEQCGIIWRPEIFAPQPLPAALAQWPAERLMVFCDEDAAVANPLDALAETQAGAGLLIGPEGGFDEEERAMITALPNVLRLSLGPRILRADTAAVAALALIQARFGDWRN